MKKTLLTILLMLFIIPLTIADINETREITIIEETTPTREIISYDSRTLEINKKLASTTITSNIAEINISKRTEPTIKTLTNRIISIEGVEQATINIRLQTNRPNTTFTIRKTPLITSNELEIIRTGEIIGTVTTNNEGWAEWEQQGFSTTLLDASLYYSADSGSYISVSLSDISDNNNDGTASNSRVFGGEGKLNEGLDFTQGTDTITISGILNTDTIEYTINLWIKVPSESITSWRFLQQSGSWTFFDVLDSTTSVNTNSWVMITVVRDDETRKLYINGVEEDTTTSSYNGVELRIVNNKLQVRFPNIVGTNVILGSATSTVPQFEGSLDEIAFFNFVLSLEQIEELYNDGEGFNPFSDIEPEEPEEPVEETPHYLDSDKVTPLMIIIISITILILFLAITQQDTFIFVYFVWTAFLVGDIIKNSSGHPEIALILFSISILLFFIRGKK